MGYSYPINLEGIVVSILSELASSIVTAQQQPQPQQQNNKTTIIVVGLRLSNRWEPHPPPQTQNYMKEQK